MSDRRMYRVTWAIDLPARSPHDAAASALHALQSGDTAVFDVEDRRSGAAALIDLAEVLDPGLAA